MSEIKESDATEIQESDALALDQISTEILAELKLGRTVLLLVEGVPHVIGHTRGKLWVKTEVEFEAMIQRNLDGFGADESGAFVSKKR